MAQQSLINYIRENLEKGYNLAQIRSHLIANGYPAEHVDEAVNYLYTNQTVRHEVHLSRASITVFIALLLSIALIGSAFYIYSIKPAKTPSKILDLKISILSESIKAGDTLKFSSELKNLGSARRYDVALEYSILDKDNSIIKSKQETVAVETSASTTSSINLPQGIESGTYMLKVNAKYDSKTAEAKEDFIVEGQEATTQPKPPAETKKCPSSCDDNNKCTLDECSAETGYKCLHKDISPCCGNGICEKNEEINCKEDCKEIPKGAKDDFEGLTIWEELDKIKEIAASDANKAAGYCSAIESSTSKDECYYNVGEVSKDTRYCAPIENQRKDDECLSNIAKLTGNKEICETLSTSDRKDSCYMNFVLAEDYSVCEKITNEYLKQSCDGMKQAKEAGINLNQT